MILTYGSWWLLWIFIQAWVLNNLALPWKEAFVDATISNIVLTLCAYATEITSRYYNPNKQKPTAQPERHASQRHPVLDP